MLHLDELSEEQIELVKKEARILASDATKCLEETKTYVEGINKVGVALIHIAIRENLCLRFDVRYFSLEYVLQWLYDYIKNSSLSDEEREMRIDQAIVICFMHSLPEEVLRRYFKKYIAPFLVKPGLTKQQMAEVIKRRIYDVSHCKIADDIFWINVQRYENELQYWERRYPTPKRRRRMLTP